MEISNMPYCLASIPKAAVKCSHCHEWVDKKGSDLKGTIVMPL
jgi:hypothetical protein